MKYSNETGLPSVTEILKPFIDTRWYKPEHSKRGSDVHGIISAKIKGMFVPKPPEHLAGYIDSALQLTRDITNVLLIEERLSDHSEGFCGKPDIVARMNHKWNNAIALIDWKTSVAEGKTFGAQLAAYRHLVSRAKGINCDITVCARLRKEPGKKILLSVYDKEETDKNFQKFMDAFRCFKNFL